MRKSRTFKQSVIAAQFTRKQPMDHQLRVVVYDLAVRTVVHRNSIRFAPKNSMTGPARNEGGRSFLLFGDGIALAFWLNGTDSAGCCVFVGGPFTESRYFGEGVGIAVKRGNETLRLALNWALFRVWEKGRFTDLWLRYFPINPF